MAEKTVTNPYYAYGILYLSENFHQWEQDKGPAYRAYRHAWITRPREMDHGEFPLNFNIEVTTRCNLACTFCTQPTLTKDQLGDLNWDHYTKLMDEAGKYGAASANFNGLGEPGLVKKLPEMIAYAKNKGLIDLMFHTNGTIMSEDIANRLIDAGLDRIIFSIDSPVKEVYEAMRLKSNYDRVTGNVAFFAEHRKKRGLKAPVIRTTMVATDETSHQVKDFVDMWKPIADQITVQDLVWQSKNIDGDKENQWTNACDSAIPVSFDKVRDEAIKRGIGFACPYLYQTAGINYNGDVVPCTSPNARKEMVMGNLGGQSMKEIWDGKPYASLRELHNTGRWHEHPVCRDCGIPNVELYKTIIKEDPNAFGAKGSPSGSAPAVVASEMALPGQVAQDLTSRLVREEAGKKTAAGLVPVRTEKVLEPSAR